jgi:hypothetical protein
MERTSSGMKTPGNTILVCEKKLCNPMEGGLVENEPIRRENQQPYELMDWYECNHEIVQWKVDWWKMNQ